jgi:hypothetical protein
MGGGLTPRAAPAGARLSARESASSIFEPAGCFESAGFAFKSGTGPQALSFLISSAILDSWMAKKRRDA